MYIVGDIAYAENFENEPKKIEEIKIISELCLQAVKKGFLTLSI